MRKKIFLIIFFTFLLAINSSLLSGLQSQDDRRQLLANAINEFTQANFDGAIQILSNIKKQLSLDKDLSNKEKEKVFFYISYCYYLLNGCGDKKTQQAVCELKLHFPNFDPKENEYQWVSQDWINCWRNTELSDSDLIESYYNSGKNLYNQNNYVPAAQEFIFVKVLIAGARKQSPDSPNYEQYKSFSEEYLNICQERIMNAWNNDLAHENYEECLKAEKQLAEVVGYREHLPKLSSYLEGKVKELLEKVNSQGWERFSTEVNNLYNTNDFIAFNSGRFQEIANEIKKYELLNNDQPAQKNQTLKDISDSFINYANFVNKRYEIRQEEKVRESLNSFKNFIIANFPELKDMVEKEYEKIINSPAPVYNNNDIGIKPPELEGGWRINPPDCMKTAPISGYVKCGITIDIQGRVEKAEIIENKLDGDKTCASQFVDQLLNYVRGRKFVPSFKIKNKPASAPLLEGKNAETIKVRYYIEKKIIIK